MFDGEKLGQEMSQIVRSYVDRQLAPILRRLDAVESKGLAYAGTWQRASEYERGNVVTHDGSAWVALKAAPAGSRPGSDPEHWQMMVKAGRDAR